MSAIVFSYHPELEIRGTLLFCEKSDNHRWIGERYHDILKVYKEEGYFGLTGEIKFISWIPVSEIQKMIDTTGYVAIWYEKNIIGE